MLRGDEMRKSLFSLSKNVTHEFVLGKNVKVGERENW